MNGRAVRTRIKRMVPPISRRDDKLADQAREIRALTRQLRRTEQRAERAEGALDDARADLQRLDRPSFHRALVDLRRTVVSLRDVDPDKRHPLRQLPVKLSNYEVAASHGVPIPTVYAVWPTTAEMDVSDLPEQFVLKTNRGAGGHGVIPVQQRPDGTLAVVNSERVVDLEEVKEEFRTRASLGGPYFAEELLSAPDGGSIPVDIKVYAFYGRIGHVLLRRPLEHGNLRRTFSKFIDEEGRDLGSAVATARTDPTIPLPVDLDTVLDVSRHLSRAVGVPFVRVDLYETGRGIVLGELTRAPGGRQTYSAEHDTLLGALLENARWRLERDLLLGRPPGILRGPHAVTDENSGGRSWDRPAPVAREPCLQWCRG